MDERNESRAWGGTSVALRAAGLLVGLLFARGMGRGVGGDMAGAPLLVYGGAVLGVICLVALFAAIVSLVKKEKWPVLGILGILLSIPAVGYGLILLLWKLTG